MANTFLFPLKDLENERIKLIPFDQATHTPLIVTGADPNPELFNWLPYGPFTSPQHYIESFLQPRIFSDPASFLYAVILKQPIPDRPNTKAGDFAGVVGLLYASPDTSACEIGYITILAPYQRSFVTTHAVGLCLTYLLDPSSQGGLGLRRVIWQAHSENQKSVGAAKRLGFHFEGIVRWQRPFPVGKPGVEVRGSRAAEESEVVRGKPGRHSAVLSICWDDWEEAGVREGLGKLMER